ncbi:MAG TPA: hypothetical protein VGR15_06840 [Bacteroidota bacterium]|jgi:hypothetical protein|nr:hypothetical protein [Bacteroidota bacterium]
MLSSLLKGIKLSLHNRRLIFVYYLANLVFALIVMVPFRSTLMSFAGNTLMGEKLAGRMDMDFAVEFIVRNSTTLGSLTFLLLVAAWLYWIFNLYLSGGAYVVLASGETYDPVRFWGNAGNYFGRFIRLFLWSIPLLVVFYCIQFVVPLVVRLVWGSDPYQSILWWSRWVRVGLAYWGILMYLIVFDYARIFAIMTDEPGMGKALRRGFRFSFKHVVTTFGISLTLFATGFLMLLVYNPLADALHAPNVFAIVALLIVQQTYIFLRMALRLTLYASQAHLYQKHHPKRTEEKLDSIQSVVIQPASE